MEISLSRSAVQSGLLLEVFEHYEVMLAEAVARVVQPHEVQGIVDATYDRMVAVLRNQPIRHPRVFMLRTARDLMIENLAAGTVHLRDLSTENGHDPESQREELPKSMRQGFNTVQPA